MLKVPPDKAITGYVPCPECQTPCGVFFPKGGRRRFIPYLSCDTCKVTMQTNDIKPYIVSRYTPTLDSYAAKYKVDVSKEQEQLAASRWTENPDSYAARIQGMDDEQEKALKDVLDPELTEHDIMPLPPVTIDSATQSVVGESDKTSSTTSTHRQTHR
ncbi:hypothetical protein AT251_20450 [Enterovibrio nigricans]|nr:hypothetical protein [Enterovibrio nigricans]PKF49222.1 hypothetical protein AT251_20450 [Enterovibrio nigricans]